MKTISRPQLTRLQTLYSQAARSLSLDNSRDDRMAWAGEVLDTPVTSFSKLSVGDAKTLIDALQATLGIAETSPARRGYTSTREREKQGTEGRRDQLHAETTMLAGDEEVLQLVRAEMTALGWNEDRLRAFLRSGRGPLGGRDAIRTLGDANSVHWALKRMREREQRRKVAA